MQARQCDAAHSIECSTGWSITTSMHSCVQMSVHMSVRMSVRMPAHVCAHLYTHMPVHMSTHTCLAPALVEQHPHHDTCMARQLCHDTPVCARACVRACVRCCATTHRSSRSNCTASAGGMVQSAAPRSLESPMQKARIQACA